MRHINRNLFNGNLFNNNKNLSNEDQNKPDFECVIRYTSAKVFCEEFQFPNIPSNKFQCEIFAYNTYLNCLIKK